MLFPCHLYKVPGPHNHCGIKYRYVGCADAKAFEKLSAEGWFATFEEAASGVRAANDAAPATRAELEQKAAELGLKFDGRTTDKLLAERIVEALA